jgi:hypothetical protein
MAYVALSTVPSLLAIATPAPLHTIMLAGASCTRQQANFHVSAQIVSGLVLAAILSLSLSVPNAVRIECVIHARIGLL